MNGSTLTKAFVALPGGAKAVYTSSGLAYYRHSDWLGHSRLSTTTTRTMYYDVAYAPFGENYNGSGTQDLSFSGQNQDTATSSAGGAGGLYDFLFREHSPVQGRWISPDPSGLAAVDPTNPQSWNRYAYVLNNPLMLADQLGLGPGDGDCYDSDSGDGQGDPEGDCEGGGDVLTPTPSGTPDCPTCTFTMTTVSTAPDPGTPPTIVVTSICGVSCAGPPAVIVTVTVTVGTPPTSGGGPQKPQQPKQQQQQQQRSQQPPQPSWWDRHPCVIPSAFALGVDVGDLLTDGAITPWAVSYSAHALACDLIM